MKTTITQTDEKRFTPFTLNVTLETPEEVAALAQLFRYPPISLYCSHFLLTPVELCEQLQSELKRQNFHCAQQNADCGSILDSKIRMAFEATEAKYKLGEPGAERPSRKF